MEKQQLDWIDSTLTREERLEMEVKRLADQCEKIRKGQYAKLGAITKVCTELRYELDHLNAHICKHNVR